jgi:hypothetical protein
MSDYGTLRRHLLAIPFELVMLGGVVVTFAKGDQVHLLASVFTLTISFLPLIMERKLRLRLPLWLQTMYVAFVFASMFSGEVFDMYARVWIWDDWMHFGSGVLIGLGVVLWVTYLQDRKSLRLPLWFQSYLVLGTAALFAVIWELAEFASDRMFGTTSQNGDLADTMIDFLLDICGAVIVAVVWRLTTKQKDPVGLGKLVTHFSKQQK